MQRRRVGVRHEATSASRFVHAGATDDYTFFRLKSVVSVRTGQSDVTSGAASQIRAIYAYRRLRYFPCTEVRNFPQLAFSA